jgi:hypothetical protein
MEARLAVRPIMDGQKIRVIVLPLEDKKPKRKAPVTKEATSKATSADKDVSKAKKPKKQPHAFIRPLRYFETAVE